MKNNNLKYTLYLASGSSGRKDLLREADLPFTVAFQDADESTCSLDQSLESLVEQLALLKMKHVQIPNGIEGQIVFVVTADTMTLVSVDGKLVLFGKPVDRDDARRMLIASREGSTTGTAFCLQKRQWSNGAWHVLDQAVGYDEAFSLIVIPDAFIDFYLDRTLFLQLSGSIAIRGLCEQFVKEVRGNYSAIIGMPMFKLREALWKLGFYE